MIRKRIEWITYSHHWSLIFVDNPVFLVKVILSISLVSFYSFSVQDKNVQFYFCCKILWWSFNSFGWGGLKTWKRYLIWMVRKSENILQILHLWTFSKDNFKILSQADGKLYTYKNTLYKINIFKINSIKYLWKYKH